MAAIRAGSVNTTWKYGTSSSSDLRCFIHSSACEPWHLGRCLLIELTRRNIPFVKFGGLKFLDAAHIKDMLALLRFVENPRDRVAGFRLLHLLPGIGSATAQREHPSDLIAD